MMSTIRCEHGSQKRTQPLCCIDSDTQHKQHIRVFLNVLTEFTDFSDKIFPNIKRTAVLKPVTSFVRDKEDIAMPRRHR